MLPSYSGLSPMRGFIQERTAKAEAQKIAFGEALLHFGCRESEKDYNCRSVLEAWELQGVVELRLVFSQAPTASGGFKYVPNRLWNVRQEVVELFQAGAEVFLCGSASKLAKRLNDILEKIAMEARICSLDEARVWLRTIK